MKKEVKIVVQTPPFRVSYPALLKPKANQEGKEFYSVQALFSPKTDLTPLINAIKEAKTKRWGNEEDWPEFKYEPLKPMGKKDKKGNVTFPEGHEAGGYVANFKSSTDYPPQVIRKFGPNKTDVRPVTDAKEVYPGCWAVARIAVRTYETPGNKGVSLYLEQVCKFKEGEPISGRMKPEDAFEAIVGVEDAEF